MQNDHQYGIDDHSYKAAGELVGISKLVNDFYDYMDNLPEAKTIRAMHATDLTDARQKLTYFLCGWLGGPRLFNQHYGPISIPRFHQQFDIEVAERDAWLLCMETAIMQQDYDDTFKQYLIEQIRIPADRVLESSRALRS